jgi:glycosyltransferase involved in cell wall biosynthesis
MRDQQPLISIGITAFNAQDTIESAVRSAYAQTWQNKEIIVVDDGSTDDTMQILQSLQALDPALRIIRGVTNSGVANSRNRLIAEAKGEFIAFFDDDDESMPDRLQKQFERISRYENVYAGGALVICHTARTQIYPDGARRYEGTMGTQVTDCAPYGSDVALRILVGQKSKHVFGSLATCSQMARLAVYKDCGGFDPDFRRSEDTELNVRLALAGAHFVGIEEPLVLQTMTLSNDKKLSEEKIYFLKLLQKNKIFIEKYYPYAACYSWSQARYDFLMGERKKFLFALLKLFLRYPVFTLQRVFWALPNIGFNFSFSRFHRE